MKKHQEDDIQAPQKPVDIDYGSSDAMRSVIDLAMQTERRVIELDRRIRNIESILADDYPQIYEGGFDG